MGQSESETKAAEAERDSLERSISDVEGKLRFLPAGTHPVLENFLRNAKSQLVVVNKKIDELNGQEKRDQEAVVVAVQLAQQETRLNAQEKEQYEGFLKDDFFTKRDFGKLEKFYALTWDRLSDRGKDEMSHRVWEGVRKNEYKFTDLPKDVQEKEEDRAYKFLKEAPAKRTDALQVPETDRTDFIHSYEKGDRAGAAHILDREAFKETMFRNAESSPFNHVSATVGKTAEGSKVVAQVKSAAQPPAKEDAQAPAGSLGGADLSALDLGGIKPPDVTAQNAAAQGKAGTARRG